MLSPLVFNYRPEEHMAEITFRNVSKLFGKTKVIENLNLTIQDGKFTVLVGPSGCGKTTLLRMIAGIGPPSSGQVWMDGQDITDLAPGKRDVAMVFQNYAIYPTMTVYDNIAFGLKNRGVSKAERERLVQEVCQAVGLSDYIQRKPGTLSGGQRQRVALARAMVKQPKVFLMDEPLSNLDAKLRVTMRVELIELHRRLNTTFVYVTHDQVEAMSMADIIVLMNEGEVVQEGTPEEIYRDPNSRFIAEFIGSPAMNMLPLSGGCTLGFRPEKVLLAADRHPKAHMARPGVITVREMLGSETLYKITFADESSVMAKSFTDSYQAGEQVIANVLGQDLYFFEEKGDRIRQKEHPARYEQLMVQAGGLT